MDTKKPPLSVRQAQIVVNRRLSEAYNHEQLEEKFIYLTNKGRGNYVTLPRLRDAIHRHTLGSLLFKYDFPCFKQLSEDLL